MSSPTPRDNPKKSIDRRALSRRIRELCIFSMFGAMMFASKILLEALPNIHMLGMFTMLFTTVYRWKALIPIYIYVAIVCVYAGFTPWCLIHLYVWLVLWAMTMVIPKRLPRGVKAVLYPIVCALHGLIYGFLCGFSQVPIYFGSLTVERLLAYTASGFYFDLLHAIGNFAFGLLILPLSLLLLKLEKRRGQV